MTNASDQKISLFEGQAVHLICLVVLLTGLYFASGLPGFTGGSFLGVTTFIWLLLAVINAIVHQVYVWLCWRLELNGQRLTQTFGKNTFQIYQTGFAVLIILRPLIAFALGWSNRGTLPIDPIAGSVIASILLVPSIYLMYSIRRYFGFDRAFGIDHFDTSYRDVPLVRKGIFRWTPNAMYVFGFFIVWVPAFLFQSVAALAAAAFSHLYIWVHYYCTEKPDMRHIYG